MMQEAGRALSVVGRAVNVAIAPIRGLVWGAERVEDWLATKVAAKLELKPVGEIVAPDLTVAGPLIEALRFNGHKPELSEMYASLLAGSMQTSTQHMAHPTFVEKIRSMTTLDAKVFEFIAENDPLPTIEVAIETAGVVGTASLAPFVNNQLFGVAKSLGFPPEKLISVMQSSLENLEDLSLIKLVESKFLTSEDHLREYLSIENGTICQAFRELDAEGSRSHVFRRGYVAITQIGRNFRSITSM